ncbi:MAG: hypothetical protein ABIN90_03150 [Knoellia sp.]
MEDLTGRGLAPALVSTGMVDPVRAAGALVAAAARAALVTLGAEGVMLVNDDSTALRVKSHSFGPRREVSHSAA